MLEPRPAIATWIKGWSLAREVAAPVVITGGFWVRVGWPEQQERYVFPGICPMLMELADTVTEPWVYLKVCAHADALRPLLPARWEIQAPGHMMVASGLIPDYGNRLAGGYHWKTELQLPVPKVTVLTDDGAIAASGRIALADDAAIYDRIITAPQHRRRGLATAVMKRLTAIACSCGITNGLLVATNEGRALYETLGWNLLAPYTSVVIPGNGSLQSG